MNRSIIPFLVASAGAVHAAPPAYHTAVAAAGPALWYQLNETTGDAVNYGSLGPAFNATYNGTLTRAAATYSGDTGVTFNSPTGFLESLGASALTGNPSFTIETIVNLQTGGSASLWGPFLHWGDGGGPDGSPQRNGREVYFSISNNLNDRAYAGFYNAGQRTASTVPTNTWIHVAWVRQGGTDTAAGTTLYINGSPVALQQDPALNPGFLAAAGINVNSTAFRINRAADYLGQRHFTGSMDEIALYPRALPPAEVAALAAASGVACYANCDNSTTAPILNVLDFSCFLNKFAAGDPYANCDSSTTPPVLNVLDFSCFLNRFAAGCP